MVCRELLHRRLAALLAVLLVAAAVGAFVAEVGILQSHDTRTEEMLEAKQAEADRELAAMEDEYRKYMKELGFNVLILPEEQDLAEFWRTGCAGGTMPEENVRRLAATGTTRMRHLLPIVQARVRWPEKERTITLVGTRGEVPIVGRGQKEPMLDPVPTRKIVLGHQLATDLGLTPGDSLRLMGKTFEVLSVRPHHGSEGDVTVWISLADAQQILALEGRIHAIEALKCHCASTGKETIAEEIRELKDGIRSALPDMQVVVRENKVTVRAKARQKAKEVHESTIRKWQSDRADLRRERENFAAVIVPLIMLAAAACIGLLALMNVRERRAEIGILRAIGLQSSQVLALFLARAAIVGIAGTLLGSIGGMAVIAARSQVGGVPFVFPYPAVVGALVLAPLVAVLAGLAPALLAAGEDPAAVLTED